MNDRFWRMPLEGLSEALNSNFADMANVAGRDGGAITAACFLWRFTKKYDWAHLDIAGWWPTRARAEKGATGRPVAALVDYVMANEKQCSGVDHRLHSRCSLTDRNQLLFRRRQSAVGDREAGGEGLCSGGGGCGW